MCGIDTRRLPAQPPSSPQFCLSIPSSSYEAIKKNGGRSIRSCQCECLSLFSLAFVLLSSRPRSVTHPSFDPLFFSPSLFFFAEGICFSFEALQTLKLKGNLLKDLSLCAKCTEQLSAIACDCREKKVFS